MYALKVALLLLNVVTLARSTHSAADPSWTQIPAPAGQYEHHLESRDGNATPPAPLRSVLDYLESRPVGLHHRSGSGENLTHYFIPPEDYRAAARAVPMESRDPEPTRHSGNDYNPVRVKGSKADVTWLHYIALQVAKNGGPWKDKFGYRARYSCQNFGSWASIDTMSDGICRACKDFTYPLRGNTVQIVGWGPYKNEKGDEMDVIVKLEAMNLEKRGPFGDQATEEKCMALLEWVLVRKCEGKNKDTRGAMVIVDGHGRRAQAPSDGYWVSYDIETYTWKCKGC